MDKIFNFNKGIDILSNLAKAKNNIEILQKKFEADKLAAEEEIQGSLSWLTKNVPEDISIFLKYRPIHFDPFGKKETSEKTILESLTLRLVDDVFNNGLKGGEGIVVLSVIDLKNVGIPKDRVESFLSNINNFLSANLTLSYEILEIDTEEIDPKRNALKLKLSAK